MEKQLKVKRIMEISKRELYAMIAMHGLTTAGYCYPSDIVPNSIQIADKLIEQLNG